VLHDVAPMTEDAECPCCKGKKRLQLIEHDETEGRTILSRPICTHCMGTGTVKVERHIRDE
jgi:DnaJ-class molecular chaperone